MEIISLVITGLVCLLVGATVVFDNRKDLVEDTGTIDYRRSRKGS